MKQIYTAIFIVLLAISSNASASFYHYRRYALSIEPTDPTFEKQYLQEPKKGLVISCELDTDKSSNYFGAFNFVFENKSDKWMVLKDIRISFLSEVQNRNVGIPVGVQYSAWVQGRQNLEDYNNKKAAFLTALVGGLAAATSNDDLTQKSGVALTVVTLAAMANATNYNEIVAGLPPYHLLRGDIVIPPGMFMKRWVLLNSTNHKESGYIHTMALQFKDQSGTPQKLYMKFRDSTEKKIGVWQSDDFKVDMKANINEIYYSE